MTDEEELHAAARRAVVEFVAGRTPEQIAAELTPEELAEIDAEIAEELAAIDDPAERR